ncbi:MAG: ankyrin repeat domain-containing protein, partial [Acidobacteriota bacterium]
MAASNRTLAAVLAALLVLFSGCSGPGESPSPEELFAAVRAGDVAETGRLLDAGVPLESEDNYGSTPLLMAAANGRVDVVRLLLDRGADPDHRETFYGAGALDMALFGDHPDVALLLVEAGADGRETALAVALQGGNLELARAAVTAGPINESALSEMRAGATELSPELQKILDAATSRPDPEPPVLSAEELTRFTGRFEGQTTDRIVEATVEGDRLWLSVDGGPKVAMTVIGDQSFGSTDAGLEAAFFGRAGTIEGLSLRSGNGPPESLRQSVAEPAGAGAFRPVEATTATGATVHWPSFRGPNASGVGDGAETRTRWDLETGEGVLWSAPIPGLGNSSPVVWGDRVFVTTAVAEGIPQEIRTGLTGEGTGVDEEVPHRWMVIAYDKWSGERLWETEVGRGVPLTRRHFKATQANSSPATDGEHLVVVFPTAGLACLDLNGDVLWHHDLG